MGEPRARGVSLWLRPEGAVGNRLSALVASLAGRLGTVPFPPHLTLLPGIGARSDEDVLATSRALARDLRPVAIRLAGVESRDEHFRCLIVRAAADAPLLAAHASAARAFGRAPDPEFLPHLSLVYGRLGREEKRRLALELEKHGDIVFDARRLHVWRTEGESRHWRELGVFDFPSTRPGREA